MNNFNIIINYLNNRSAANELATNLEENYNIRKLWKIKSKEELFGKISSPYITNVMLLSGYKIHEENIDNISVIYISWM